MNTTANTTSALGGSTSTLTPGKVAKAAKSVKAKAAKSTEKRAYTPRNSTYHARRVVLLDGEPVGRGRPTKTGKGTRTVVYVPIGMDYSLKLHGPGVRFNTATHAAATRRIPKDSVDYTFEGGKVTPQRKAVKAKVAKKSVRSKKLTVVPVTVTVDTSPVASTAAVAPESELVAA